MILTCVWLVLLVIHSVLLIKAMLKEEGAFIELRETIWVGTCTIMAYLCSHI